jgi:hypothetical protein
MSIDETLKDVQNFLAWQRHQIIENFKKDNPKYKDCVIFYDFYNDLKIDGQYLEDLESWERTEELVKLYKDLHFYI